MDARWLKRLLGHPVDDATAEEKLEAIRTKGRSDPPLKPSDITGVQRLALAELAESMQATRVEDKRALEALHQTCEGICSVAPPPEG